MCMAGLQLYLLFIDVDIYWLVNFVKKGRNAHMMNVLMRKVVGKTA